MNRRKFVKWSGSLVATAGLGAWRLPLAFAGSRQPDGNDLLAPVDLRERIRLAQSALLGGLDAGRRHLPYWSCAFDRGDLQGFRHGLYDGEGVWDRMHNAGRALHALTQAEAVTGDRVDSAILGDLADYLVGTFSAGDGLPGDSGTVAGRRVASLHNVREALNGLTALIRSGDARAAPLARTMVRTLRRCLDEAGRLHPGRLPAYVAAYTSQPHMEGRSVDALVRYFRASGDEVALETAGLLTRFALAHCFTAGGALTPLAGTHGHSINVLVAGMIDYARETRDAGLLAQARQAFDVGLAEFNTSFGWSMESLHRPVLRGEANNTGDLLRAALLLGQAGLPGYLDRAERILRSHLLPSQLLDVAGLSDRSDVAEDSRRRLASRVRGGFAVPTPNDLQLAPDAPVFVFDITSGALDALCAVHRAIVHDGPDDLRLDLLLSTDTADLGVRSDLSGDGRIELANRRGREVCIRIPRWVAPADVVVTVDGARREPRFSDSCLRVAGTGAAQAITVRFPVRRERTVETIVHQPFTIDWQGDQIVAMSPPATPNPQGAPLPPRCRPLFPPCQ